MSTEQSSGKEMGALSRIVGIFTSPRETFESIDRKPTWLVPFLIIVILMVVRQFLIMDIGIQDQLAMMEARDVPAERIEMARTQAAGPLKYLSIGFIPVVILIVWVVLAGIFLFVGNTVMGGESKFKKVFSVMAWSSLIGLVGEVLKTFLIMSKGTAQGVVTSLAILLPTPQAGQTPSVLYRLLSRFDVFTIWTMAIWIIGMAVIFRFTTKKSATLVLSLWAIYIILAVALGGLFSSFTGM
jgi:hypothetical protein